MAYSYSQQAAMPPAFDSSMQGAPGAPQMDAMNAQAYPGMQAPAMPAPGAQGQFNPALVSSVLGLQGQQSQQAMLDRQRKMADSMRADAKNQLQGTQAGRVYKSAGLANLGASLADNYVAGQMDKGANDKAAALDTQRQGAMKDWFNQLTGGGGSAAGSGQ